MSSDKWDDKNDVHTIAVYKRKRPKSSVLLMCLARPAETFHHWRIYGGKAKRDKMCVTFQKDLLLDSLKGTPALRYNRVRYRKVETIRAIRPKVGGLPFLKRIQFRDEREFRILWESDTSKRTQKGIPVDLRSIKTIMFSPWISKSLFQHRNVLINRILRNAGISDATDVKRSYLVDSGVWKRAIDKHYPEGG
jgi:hypothetical protein